MRQGKEKGELLRYRPFAGISRLGIAVSRGRQDEQKAVRGSRHPGDPVLSERETRARKGTEYEPRGGEGTDDFLREVANVVPLAERERRRVEPVAPGRRAPRPPKEEDEARAFLSDLVSGAVPFDIAETDEYVEGVVRGLNPELVRRLRMGEFARQDYLDLHGMTADEARKAVEAFLLSSHRKGYRCVLIVHGRGKNSKNQVPVLKRHLKDWLARGSCSRLVLAFTSARPCDGGTGALYALLRRKRGPKTRLDVFDAGS
ncbi:MAG: hypothetical protein KatS3mg076_1375 [Candidatus Binatia bacterium]|nr:MAG: hypothetical protein KatS3mg076_1375 [Candidatus Binatia bacterium]